jgi:hypothetical protein
MDPDAPAAAAGSEPDRLTDARRCHGAVARVDSLPQASATSIICRNIVCSRDARSGSQRVVSSSM